MVQVHSKSIRKVSGGKRRKARKKKLRDLGGNWVPLVPGEGKRREKRTRGGGKKFALTRTHDINLNKKGKTEKARLLRVLENEANPNFVRRNIVTKGAIVETDKGKAKITSKPGSDGVLNAVALE